MGAFIFGRRGWYYTQRLNPLFGISMSSRTYVTGEIIRQLNNIVEHLDYERKNGYLKRDFNNHYDKIFHTKRETEVNLFHNSTKFR